MQRGPLPILSDLISSVTFQPLDIPEDLPTCIGSLYDPTQVENLPSKVDIHYWMQGDDDEDNTTVCRMLDLLEDAKEPEDAKDIKEQLHLYGGVVELLDD